MLKNEVAEHHPLSRAEWRQWLTDNHIAKQSVWLIYYKKELNKPTITWSEAVDEALCFGWVDSVKKTIDDERFMQLFSKRKIKTTWSKINKAKIDLLTAQRLMVPAGLEAVKLAKKNGSWKILDKVERLIIPKDLSVEFKLYPGSRQFFTGLNKSVKKGMLQWLVLAKRPATRQKRIMEIVALAALRQKPKQF